MFLIKLLWWMIVAELWLAWFCVVLLALIVCSITGNKRAAQSWSRSLNWHRVFDPF